jgi:ABC-type spermidine/putrescine transport system permease subunit II
MSRATIAMRRGFAADSGVAASALSARHRLPRWLWPGFLVAVLTVLVIYPITMLTVGSLTDVNPAAEAYDFSALTLAHYRDIFVNANVRMAVFNSLLTAVAGSTIAIVIGLFFAWVVTRTNTPLKGVIEMAGIMPLFIPPLVAGFAWSLLGSPETGLINVLFEAIGLPARINLYSLAGIIFVFGVYYAPYVFLFTAATLQNMDPSLEEASEISGVGPLGTMAADHAAFDGARDPLWRSPRFRHHPGHLRHSRDLGDAGPGTVPHHLHLHAGVMDAAALQQGGRSFDDSDRRDGGGRLPATEGLERP